MTDDYGWGHGDDSLGAQLRLAASFCTALLRDDREAIAVLLNNEPCGIQTDAVLSALVCLAGILACNTDDCDPDKFDGNGHAAVAETMAVWTRQISEAQAG